MSVNQTFLAKNNHVKTNLALVKGDGYRQKVLDKISIQGVDNTTPLYADNL